MKQSAKLRAIGTALITLGAGMVISTTHAASPPDSWVNERIIGCDGVEIQTFLGPPGFGTPFNIVGSSEVIIPKVVVVTFDGQTLQLAVFLVSILTVLTWSSAVTPIP